VDGKALSAYVRVVSEIMSMYSKGKVDGFLFSQQQGNDAK